MYVKVTHGESNSDFIAEAHGPIHSGSRIFALDEIDDDPDWTTLLDIFHGQAWVLDIKPFGVDPAEETKGYDVRYAWWATDDIIGGVITTRNIFIVGNDGKTIDRVR